MLERWLYTCTNLSVAYEPNRGMERTNDLDEAVLRSSELKEPATGIKWMDDNPMHAPAIDIDMHCELVPSSTEGHYHLYIDKEMPWKDYLKLLTVMNEVGIVQDGFLRLAKKNKASFLRVRSKSEDPGRDTGPFTAFGKRKNNVVQLTGAPLALELIPEGTHILDLAPCSDYPCDICEDLAGEAGWDYDEWYAIHWGVKGAN